MMSEEKRRGIVGAAVAVLACLVAERVFLHGNNHGPWWAAIPGFYALFGFVGGVLLSYGAKLLAKHIILRKEGYYDRD